jgi:hypothetical protein
MAWLSLYEKRLDCLSEELPASWQQKMEMHFEQATLWKKAMQWAYDCLTADPTVFFGATQQTTYLKAFALEPSGEFSRNGVTEKSGPDNLEDELKGAFTAKWGGKSGWCAERKLLVNSLAQEELRRRGMWLFYLTRSPCTACSTAIAEALQEGFLKYLVIAFEEFYGEVPSDEFFKRVKTKYSSLDPGVELFKVYRSHDDSAKLAEENDSVQLPDMEPERVVYSMRLGGPRSRRRRDVDVPGKLLRRETRSVGVFYSKGGEHAVLSGEIKDMLAREDCTLRFRRITKSSK